MGPTPVDISDDPHPSAGHSTASLHFTEQQAQDTPTITPAHSRSSNQVQMLLPSLCPETVLYICTIDDQVRVLQISMFSRGLVQTVLQFVQVNSDHDHLINAMMMMIIKFD